MDPNATWKLLLEPLAAVELEEATEAVYNLREWISKGGFPPEDCPYYAQAQKNGLGFLSIVLGRVLQLRSSQSEAEAHPNFSSVADKDKGEPQ